MIGTLRALWRGLLNRLGLRLSIELLLETDQLEAESRLG